jgi:hypothetical protein
MCENVILNERGNETRKIMPLIIVQNKLRTIFPMDRRRRVKQVSPTRHSKEASPGERQEKGLVMYQRLEDYKNFFGDLSQISDERCLESLRRHSCPLSFLDDGETKTLPQADREGERALALISTSVARINGISESKSSSLSDRQTTGDRDYRIGERLRSESTPHLGNLNKVCTFEEQIIQAKRDRARALAGQTITRMDDFNWIGSVEFHQNPSPTPPTVFAEPEPGFTGACAVAAPEAKFIVRKKNRPLHRCLSTNSMVTGIIKPSRYSQGDAQLNRSMHSYLTNHSRRSTTGGHMNSYMRSNLIKSSQNYQGDFQSHSSMYDSIMHSYRPISSSNSNSANLDRWIPKGVEFSPSSEVLVFEISNELRSAPETSLPAIW